MTNLSCTFITFGRFPIRLQTLGIIIIDIINPPQLRIKQSSEKIISHLVRQLLRLHVARCSIQIVLTIEMYSTFIIIRKELVAHIVGFAVVVHCNAYQRIVGFVPIGLVLCLCIKQGIEGTIAILPHFIGRNRIQECPGRIGVFVHQCLGTVKSIGYGLRVVARYQSH